MVTWYVVFEDIAPESPAHWWLGRILSRGFQHCWAFRDTAAGMLVVNLNVGFLETDCTPDLTAEAWAAHCRQGGLTVLRVDRALDAKKGVQRIANCVTVVRLLLGLPAWPQTPKRLHRQLSRLEGALQGPQP